jgi:nickel superoxide dismutase
MMKRAKHYLIAFAIAMQGVVEAHCQMPCGIYHDQMVYEKIDEYFETMIKAVSAMNDSKFDTAKEKNQFIRWVITKENMSNEISEIILTYFLQQKIKPGEGEDTDKLLRSSHKLLFDIVQIKQNSDLRLVKQFGEDWEYFKTLFHREDACREAARLLKELTIPDEPQE